MLLCLCALGLPLSAPSASIRLCLPLQVVQPNRSKSVKLKVAVVDPVATLYALQGFFL